ncbi:tagaturonate reductase [Sediminibacterium ginsengisoli]|uniref:Tagaturonate reductase n=1 Tax=Sediminibacterium ginsengisoli TaxID=413434 RepID=A0A1T4K3D7_9BACT|nr:tagaturonate reductase [Sediminibacterium ginsengisoli]SJZ36863.1 tagaturonate reductase [Sediminibacterium ginsengisoli]
MQLSRTTVAQISNSGVEKPADALFQLPEKVLQFGTGVLLRGLPDYFIDKANKQGLFNGRVVVVKSTATGGTDAFKKQDGLFTLLERGFEAGERKDRAVINAAISRVLSAHDEWEIILSCAASAEMQVIISNTTEVGITLVPEDARAEKPASFPGKLLAFLKKRYEAFNGSAEAGMVIIPTELIVDNGKKLKAIVLELARLQQATDAFINWLNEANDFCSSLVDRIVPGKLNSADAKLEQEKLGYEDELLIMSECYRLWAIETASERTKAILSFSKADAGVVLAPDINKFRELKLRLLNGTHTFACGLACLAGYETVKEAMQDEDFRTYVSELMYQEIVPLVAGETITTEEANEFATSVIDRFRNTHIEHLWLNITVQYSSKMAMRNVPLLKKYYAQSGSVPERMAIGFAAYLRFMRSRLTDNNCYTGSHKGTDYQIQDDKAGILHQAWSTTGNIQEYVAAVLNDETLWGCRLSELPGFEAAVTACFSQLEENDVTSVITKKAEV